MTEEKRPRYLPFAWWVPLAVGATLGLGMRLIFSGKDVFSVMGSPYFFLSPFAVGAATVYAAERQKRRTIDYHATAPLAATALYVVGAFAMMLEGLICIVFALPIFAVMGTIGGVLMGAICHKIDWPKPKYTAYGFVALPILLGFFPAHEAQHTRIRDVKRTLVIAAPPEAIWYVINNAREIRPHEVQQGWVYRIGVPLPISGVTEETSSGRLRHITMGKSVRFDQVITRWLENEDLLCTYRFAADSFPEGVLDDHVRIGGRYFDVLETEYRIVRLSKQASSLELRMRYRVSTDFNWYAEPIARVLTGNLEETLLAFYQARAVRQTLIPPAGGGGASDRRARK